MLDDCSTPLILSVTLGLFTKQVDYTFAFVHADLDEIVYGAFAYVLDPTLQDGKTLPKWQPCSRSAQFLGFSMDHSKSFCLVRILQTSFVSPQFHVVYDDHFTTIANQNSETNVPPNWEDLLNFHSVRLIEPETELHPDMMEEERLLHLAPPLSDDWLTAEEIAARDQREPQPATAQTTDLSDREGDGEVTANDDQTDQQDPPNPDPNPNGDRRNPHRQARDRSHRGGSNPHAGLFVEPMDPKEMANVAFLASLPENILGDFQK